MTRILLIFGFLLISVWIYAQNIEFKKSNFKDDVEGFKAAKEDFEKGNEYFKTAEEQLENNQDAEIALSDALDFFIKANAFNPECAELNYKIGKCMIHLPDKKLKAISYLEKSIKLDPDNDFFKYYYLGMGKQYKYKFEEAKKHYKTFENKLKDKHFDDVKRDFKKRIKECDAGIEFKNNPRKVWIKQIEEINTKYPDYCATITADMEMMMFNSKRPNTTGGQKAEDRYFYADLYITNYKNGKWSNPDNKSVSFNTSEQDEILALSPDGQSMFVYKYNETDGKGDIFKTDLAGNTWSKPEKLTTKINTDYDETHASFSYDGLKIYYITNQPAGTEGGQDVFFSGLMDKNNNTWGKGLTISHDINTKYHEGSIYMHPDGKTMYFSSQGHNSMGGYDIFVSHWGDNGRWSDPENMGYPINTPFDEVYFVMSGSGKYAYVTSNREQEGVGHYDIYQIKFISGDKPAAIDGEDQLLSSIADPIQEATIEEAVQVETKNLTVLKGVIIDNFTEKPVEATIEIIDNTKNELISSFKSNSATGKFLVSLPSGKNYGIAVKAEGYLFHSENFDLPETAPYQLVDKLIKLKNVDIGSKIVLKNVFFDTGKSSLKPESTPELMRLVKLLKDIPKLRIEISGHTDNVGADNINQQLSEKRARAVVNFLKSKGISESRLEYKGYGETDPIADNSTSEGRRQNRRTEFKIITNN